MCVCVGGGGGGGVKNSPLAGQIISKLFHLQFCLKTQTMQPGPLNTQKSEFIRNANGRLLQKEIGKSCASLEHFLLIGLN